MQKQEQKVKLRNGLLLYFYYKVFQRNTLNLTTNLVSYFFALKFLFFFSLTELNSAKMGSNNSLLNAF